MKIRLLLIAMALAVSSIQAASSTAQTVLFNIDATTGELVSGTHTFGFRDDASTSYDGYDTPEPPAAPAEYLSIAFVMPDPGNIFPNRWRDDIRRSDDFEDRCELWQMSIDTDRVGSPLRLFTSVLFGEEYELEIRLLGLPQGPIVVAVPGTIDFVLDSAQSTVWFELTSEIAIETKTGSWGAIRSTFR